MIEIKHRLTGEVIVTLDGDSLRGSDLEGAHLEKAIIDDNYTDRDTGIYAEFMKRIKRLFK